MRRTASEVIRELEMRIARLESNRIDPRNYRLASARTASPTIEVSISKGGPKNKVEKMTVQKLLSLVKSEGKGRKCQVNIVPNGNRSKVNFICHRQDAYISDVQWSCSVDMYDLINAIEEAHPKEMEALIMNANVMDEGDADDMAYAVQDWLQTSRGSFGGSLGSDWFVRVI